MIYDFGLPYILHYVNETPDILGFFRLNVTFCNKIEALIYGDLKVDKGKSRCYSQARDLTFL